MDDDLLRSYDEIPYESDPLYFTHPDALGTAAFLAGMEPAAIENCRLLEIGCSTGGNLIPMAYSLRKSRFVGIDLSPRQIEIGSAHVATLGLGNLELRAMNLMEIDRAFGEFDYIVCHGVYSWCPPVVQDKILQICSKNLSKNGVAYVSYNTYPGWHRWMTVREMLNYQAAHLDTPRARVKAAREYLDTLELRLPSEGTHATQIRESIAQLRSIPDAYLFHEYLESVNEPVYFHEMVARAAAHNLAWLGESAQQTFMTDLTPAAQQSLMRSARDEIDLEQQLDFLRYRMFRRSLFVHADAKIDRARARTPSMEQLQGLAINATCKPASATPDVLSDASEVFRAERVQISTSSQLVKALLVGLFEIWPRTLTLAELIHALRARLGDRSLRDEDVAATVAECHGMNLVGLHLWAPVFAREPGEKPRASAVARLRAPGAASLPNLRHRLYEVSPFDLALVALCDGTRDRAALVEGMMAAAARGDFTVEKAGVPLTDPAILRPLLGDVLESALRRFAQHALLES